MPLRHPRYWFSCGFLVGLSVAASGYLLSMAAGGPDDGAGPDARLRLRAGVVASVDGEPITSQSLIDEMARRARVAPALFRDPAARRELLEERIRLETLAARAREAGYERDAVLARQWKQLLARRYEADQLATQLAGVNVSDTEIEAYYHEHLADYTRPERRRLALIFIAVPRRASAERIEELTRRAEQVLADARADEGSTPHFGDLARTHSEDRATRYLGGDVGWVLAGQRSYRWEPEVVEAMFALSEPGEISPVVRASRGLYLLKLSDVEPARAQPLDTIRPTIRHVLLEAKREHLSASFYAELAKQTEIEIDLEELEALTVPEGIASAPETMGPPSLPMGQDG